MTLVALRPDSFITELSSPPRADRFQPGFSGLRCRACGEPAAEAAVFVCSRCFGPLEAGYDLAGLRSRLSHELLDARDASIWRFAELLPLANPACRRASSRRLAARGGAAPGLPAWFGAALGQGRLAKPDALVQGPRRGRGRGPCRGVWASTRSPVPPPATSPRPSRLPRRPGGCARSSSCRPTWRRPRSPRRVPWAPPSCPSTARTMRSTGSAWSSPTSWRAGPS